MMDESVGVVDTALRAADADRERVAERLRRAHAEGRIDLTEFDERIAATYAARTYGELEPVTADLPATPGADQAGQIGQAGQARQTGHRRRAARGWALALRIEAGAWLFASALNLMIWALVSLAGASLVYPWWVWVAGPWGVVLLAQATLRRRLVRSACTRF